MGAAHSVARRHRTPGESRVAHKVTDSSGGGAGHLGGNGSGGGAAGHSASSSTNGSRVLVDIRGANLEHNYNIWIKRQPVQDAEQKLKSFVNTFQALGGIVVTVLTAQKLFEEVRFVRSLRRELSGLAAVVSEAEPAHGGKGGHAGAADGLFAALDGAHAYSNDEGTKWSSIAGLKEVKMLLQEATVLPILRPDMFAGIRQPSRGILLFGPPGTGKTMLARAVATESKATFLPITGSSILSMWYGQSEQNVKALFEKAKAQQPAVIFIDEVDSLLSKRSDRAGDSMPDRRVTNEFLAYIDGIQMSEHSSRIVVIAATNNPWELDEAALSRFARRIFVPLPDKATRALLLSKAMHGVEVDMSAEDYERIADKSAQYSGRDLIQVCREASMRPLRELWGERLLESGGDVLLEQRLLDFTAKQMGRGHSKKRLRKELDRFKHKNKAAWLNVDALLAAADKRRDAEEAQDEEGGLGTSHAQGAAAEGGHNNDGERMIGDEDNADAQRVDTLQRGGSIGDGCQNDAQCSSEEQKEKANVGDDACGDAVAQPCTAPPPLECNAEINAAATSSKEGKTDEDQISGKPMTMKFQKGESWTVGELLSLPVEKLRPVKVDDFEVALKQIMHTEFDQGTRFREWNQQFGSGLDAKDSQRYKYFPMYV